MNSIEKQEFNKSKEWAPEDVDSLQLMSSKQSKLIGLFVFAMVLLNFPLLGIFSRPSFLGGIPSVFIYLFVVWVIIIFLIRLNDDTKSTHDRKNKKDSENDK